MVVVVAVVLGGGGKITYLMLKKTEKGVGFAVERYAIYPAFTFDCCLPTM